MESLDYICQSCNIEGDNLKTATLFDLLARVLFSTAPILILDMMRRKDVLVFGMFIVLLIMVTYIIVFLAFSEKVSVDYTQQAYDWIIKVRFLMKRLL